MASMRSDNNLRTAKFVGNLGAGWSCAFRNLFSRLAFGSGGRELGRNRLAGGQLADGGSQQRPEGLQSFAVIERQVAQQPLAPAGQFNQHHATVRSGRAAAYQPVALRAIDKLDRAVVLDLQPAGKFTNGGLQAGGQAFNGQQQLMLLRFEASFARGFLTEAQEVANVIAQLGERAIFGSGDSGLCVAWHRAGSTWRAHLT